MCVRRRTLAQSGQLAAAEPGGCTAASPQSDLSRPKRAYRSGEGLYAMEPRYGLDKAVAKFFPDGSITKDALKHQIRQGRLRAELIAGRYFVTESNLLALCLARQRNAPSITSTVVGDVADGRSA